MMRVGGALLEFGNQVLIEAPGMVGFGVYQQAPTADLFADLFADFFFANCSHPAQYILQ